MVEHSKDMRKHEVPQMLDGADAAGHAQHESVGRRATRHASNLSFLISPYKEFSELGRCDCQIAPVATPFHQFSSQCAVGQVCNLSLVEGE